MITPCGKQDQPNLPDELRCVAVLGATGSIGTATIDVVRKLGPSWRCVALSAHQSARPLSELCNQTMPSIVVFSGAASPPSDLTLPTGTEVLCGEEGLVQAATHAEVGTVVAAIVGRAGVESTLAAIKAGKRVALANKETLVCAGPVVEEIVLGGRFGSEDLGESSEDSTTAADSIDCNRKGSVFGGPRALVSQQLLPVDSEHSAIFQCLMAGPGKPRRLILTASGGPFRDWTAEQMADATPEQAVKHPTWTMGKKISVDSATMMNKALELIEARWLFDIPAEHLEVVIHHQSIVHSMVEFEDGSVVAQMSPPDMRLPIQFALTYPIRVDCPAPRLDRTKSWELTFQSVDRDRFPAIELGFEVAAAGGTAGSVINAANEQAVDLFLAGKIRFTDIVSACRSVLENHTFEARPSLERLLQLDRWARAEVRRWSCRTVG